MKILIAEDDRTNQQIARIWLTRGGHSVTIVQNGHCGSGLSDLSNLHQARKRKDAGRTLAFSQLVDVDLELANRDRGE